MAQTFATLGCLNPGRVILGRWNRGSDERTRSLGAGVPRIQGAVRPARRSDQLIRALWSGDRITFDGTYYRTVDAKLYDTPDSQCPSTSPPADRKWPRYAGADSATASSAHPAKEWTCTPTGCSPPSPKGLTTAHPAGGLRSDDRNQTVLRPRPARALENTRFWAPLSLSAEDKHGLTDSRDIERAADTLPIEQVARRWIVASDPETAMAGIQPYIDADSPTWSSTPPAPTKHDSSTNSLRTFSRCSERYSPAAAVLRRNRLLVNPRRRRSFNSLI